jgi:hypothetical protein
MEVLRVSPFADIDKSFTIPAGYSNVDVSVTMTDLSDMSTSISTYPGVSSGYEIVTAIPGEYDNAYRIQITIPGEGSSIQTLSDQTYDLIRPYVNPELLATSGTATEIAEYTVLEMVARSMIDSYTNSDFLKKKTVLQINGNGGDYLPLWNNVNRVIKLSENNVLLYDADAEDQSTNLSNYTLTPDKTAIQRIEIDSYNRVEGSVLPMPISSGDLGYGGGRFATFPAGYDYTVVVDEGYQTIPADVEYAAKLLIEDIKCGKLDYYKRYTTSYSTDQFRIQFDKSGFSGTGNLIVDKILEKYMLSVTRVGII